MKKLKVFKGQSGFSLMEVMFAVVILSLGLVFVACQFPVGIDAVRDVVDETNKIIDAHNSQVMLELQLTQIGSANLGNALDMRPTGYSAGFPPPSDIMTVYPLVKPNVLADPAINPGPISGLTYPTLVIDDPEDLGSLILSVNPQPQWPFWSQINNPAYSADYNGYYPVTNAFIGDIGYIMSPPVDESDPEVVEILKNVNYFPTIMDNRVRYLHPAIYEVALERNYTWAAIYIQPRGNARSIEFYIFTLRNPKKQVRYAVQHPDSFHIYQSSPGEPYEQPIGFHAYGRWPDQEVRPIVQGDGLWSGAYAERYMDRMFPVPWRVCLGPYSQRYVNSTGNWEGPDNFKISEAIAKILRPGSIIVDADPADRDTDTSETPPVDYTTGQSGQIYEVSEVFLDDAKQFWMRLRTPLYDDLHYFWVFPPPIKRIGNDYEFEDAQPVVEVTKKIINF